MGCISEDELLEYVERRLPGRDAPAVESHLRGCAACRMAIAELARPSVEGAPAPPADPPAHYEVLEPIGAGAMGVVYAARDLRLGRRVALKMLQPGADRDAGPARTRERLLREARAMARLSHPNVLAVYDVGELDGQIFVAMELVDGATLGAWLRESRRTWRDVLAVFVAAGRGLAAAHAAGLIHRDFKPENVLIGNDGRVRVTDFGLASVLATAAGAERDAPVGSRTATGGSPAYMAPEQLRGEPVDGRADVFACCVALHEALHGERPFRGESVGELERAIRAGRVDAPRRRGVPGWLRRTVLRGLRHDREKRWPSMDAFVSALERGRTRATVRAAAGWALLVAAMVLAIALVAPRRVLRPAGAVTEIASLAVLPFDDFAGAASGAPLADELTEALTTDLGRTHARVISRHSANAYGASRRPAATIARELNVDAVVVGRVRRAGDDLRVEVQVVRASTGEQIWAARFLGGARNLAALEEEIFRAVLGAVALTPAGHDRARVRPEPTPEAFDLYLAGKIHRSRENEADNTEAIRLLERAIALDPDFAAAQAELSRAYELRVAQLAPGDGAALSRAEVAAQKALLLDPDLAEAHYATAFLLWGARPDRFLAERAVQELKRALALNPNLAEAHHALGMLYLHVGLFDRARQEFEATIRLDPTDGNAVRRIALVLAWSGAYDEALRTLRQVSQQANPSMWSYDRAWTLQHAGRRQEASAVIDAYLRGHPEDRGGIVTSTRAVLLAESGDARRARANVRAAILKGKGFVHFHHTAYNAAAVYALLGDASESVRWLRVAAATGFPCYPLFAGDPNLIRIRSDPAYVRLMNDLKADWERYRDTL